jgi:DHA1 family bicyclomycin/chloramphenicol resistance-like MFS transporter
MRLRSAAASAIGCRFVEGVGAASTAMSFAIIRDLFSEATTRAKIANVAIAINVVTVIAPTAGAALLTIGRWQSIYAIQAGIGALLLLAVLNAEATSRIADQSSERFAGLRCPPSRYRRNAISNP